MRRGQWAQPDRVGDPDQMIKYTIENINSGEVQSGLSACDAASELLGHDGAEWEIRPDCENGAIVGFFLWHRKPNAGKPWTKTLIYSAAEQREEAENEIFELVIGCGFWDRDDIFCGTDDHHRKIKAEMRADNASHYDF